MNSLQTTPRVLVVDDEAGIREVLVWLLEDEGYRVATAESAEVALCRLQTDGFDILLMDIDLPEMDGFELLRRVTAQSAHLPVLILSGSADHDLAIAALRQGARAYIHKPFRREELLLSLDRALEWRSLIRNAELGREAAWGAAAEPMRGSPASPNPDARGYEMALVAISSALDLHGCQGEGHSLRVCAFSARLAEELGLPSGRKEVLRQAALLHDIGNLAIPETILLKPAPLTAEERAVVETHPTQGYEILRQVDSLRDAAEVVLQHHERCDGTGYPRGLRQEETSWEAQLIGVFEALDSMTAVRAYRGPLSGAAAREGIARGRGRQFRPELVDAFLQIDPAEWQSPAETRATPKPADAREQPDPYLP